MKRTILSLCVALMTVNCVNAGSLLFSGVNVPVTDEEKRSVLASEVAIIDGVACPIGYNVIVRSGDVVNGVTFGQLYDQDGNAILAEDGSPFISNDNDFSSLLPVVNKLFMVNHFESRPGGMYLTELAQDENGHLSAVSTKPIDFSAWGGLWVPCAGSVTPWGTHLGSEEYPPDARSIEEAASLDEFDPLPDDPDETYYIRPMGRYFGFTNPWDPNSMSLDEFRSVFNPYYYGYPTEVAVTEDGSATVTKHYALGRYALELAYVMPDKKTVYMTDDGVNVGLFMFIADTPGDLSAGNLYAMRWYQTSASNGGSADLGWVPLGHATTEEIKQAIDSGVTFNDIFEVAEWDPNAALPRGFTSINCYQGGGSDPESRMEILRVKPGMEKIASRLETRRYAAIMGATTEMRKEEGVTYDPDHNRLYVAMSEVSRGMEDFAKSGKPNDTYDIGGWNDVRLDYIDGGAVYALDLAPDASIGSDYVAQNMYAIIRSFDGNYDETSPYFGNKHFVGSISNPDNVTYLPGYDTLIIGEDSSSGHQNDMIWAFNVVTEQLTRIQTTPFGSETTSPYFYPNINGHAYIMSVIQHPYGESDEDKLLDPSEAAAYIGYIGPFPAME
jgi:hypothetical protein